MALHQRLLRDIAELQEEPYPNIKVIPYDNDITSACLLLTTDEDVPLHLTIKFTELYPLDPPKVSIQTLVVHPNVFGNYICASILNTKEGYTPAYTLKGICIQLLSFFASDSIQQTFGLRVDLTSFRHAQRSYLDGHHYCHRCNYITADQASGRLSRSVAVSLGAYFPQQKAAAPQPEPISLSAPCPVTPHDDEVDAMVDSRGYATVSDLPDEILVLICNQLTIEELAPFSRAWDRIGGEAGIVSRFNIIRNRELICFCFKKGIDSANLGIGVHVDMRGRIGSLESEFDLLSEQAFKEFHIRTSVQGLPFEHWLPLPISRRHYRSVNRMVQPKLALIAGAAQFPSTSAVDTIYAFMNDIVVRLSKQAETTNPRSSLVHASEKAIESYYHLFHLLLCLAAENPGIVTNVNKTIKEFLAGKTTKTDVPNLGYLLIKILISDIRMSRELLMAIIRETVARNVVWMLDKRGANIPELAYMEDNQISHYRLQKTFEASKTSYRLLMFLNLFRLTIDRGTKSLVELREELFDAHGAPPKGTAAKLANDIKALQKVKNFPEFLKIMCLQPPSASQFTAFLRNCVEDSMKKRYSVWGIGQKTALELRRQVDPDVKVRKHPKLEWKKHWNLNHEMSFFPRGGGNGRGRGGRVRG